MEKMDIDNSIIDSAAFNALFNDVPANRDAIFIALRELSRRTAGTLNFYTSDDRDDAISDGLIHAVERIDRYRPGRQRAAAYFFCLIRRRMLKFLGGQKSALRDLPPVGEESSRNSLFDAKRRPLEQIHVSQYQRFETRLEEEPARDRARAVIDRSLRRTMRFMQAADTDLDRMRGQAAMDVLQELRKQLLGRYNRISADHARFTDERRVENPR